MEQYAIRDDYVALGERVGNVHLPVESREVIGKLMVDWGGMVEIDKYWNQKQHRTDEARQRVLLARCRRSGLAEVR